MYNGVVRWSPVCCIRWFNTHGERAWNEQRKVLAKGATSWSSPVAAPRVMWPYGWAQGWQSAVRCGAQCLWVLKLILPHHDAFIGAVWRDDWSGRAFRHIKYCARCWILSRRPKYEGRTARWEGHILWGGRLELHIRWGFPGSRDEIPSSFQAPLLAMDLTWPVNIRALFISTLSIEMEAFRGSALPSRRMVGMWVARGQRLRETSITCIFSRARFICHLRPHTTIIWRTWSYSGECLGAVISIWMYF